VPGAPFRAPGFFAYLEIGMAYASLDQLLEYLPQLVDEVAQHAVLESVLDRATSIINLEIGVTSDLTAAAAGSRVVYGAGTPYLTLPANASAVTAVTTLSGYTVPDYVYSSDGYLIATDSTGILTPLSTSYGITTVYGVYYPVWQDRLPYTVAATYGYNADVITAATEACLQIAVRLFRFRDSGGSEVIGTDAGVVEVRSQYSPLVKRILDAIDAQAMPGVGIW
jgi:hypothetical protein